MSYSLDELQNEKKRVKNELKVYDQDFYTKFKRPPTRSEKEPMRNLYMYYKRLKQYIDKREKNEARDVYEQPQDRCGSKFADAAKKDFPGDAVPNKIMGSNPSGNVI